MRELLVGGADVFVRAGLVALRLVGDGLQRRLELVELLHDLGSRGLAFVVLVPEALDALCFFLWKSICDARDGGALLVALEHFRPVPRFAAEVIDDDVTYPRHPLHHIVHERELIQIARLEAEMASQEVAQHGEAEGVATHRLGVRHLTAVHAPAVARLVLEALHVVHEVERARRAEAPLPQIAVEQDADEKRQDEHRGQNDGKGHDIPPCAQA